MADKPNGGWLISQDWFLWLTILKQRVEDLPGEVAAENIIGPLQPDQIPQLPSSRLTFTNSPRLLGRTTAGSGPSEEIQVAGGLQLTGGVLSALLVPGGYTIGDLFYANTINSIARLADVSVGSYLRSGGVGVAPLWSTVKLPNAATTGDLLYASASNVYSNLADAVAGAYLRSGGVATAPGWQSAAALTKVDDANVTLSLGGSPTTALLNAASLTLGWNGTLSVARGGTGTGTAFTQGSVVFAGASGVYTENNSEFFWNNTTKALSVGTNTPAAILYSTMATPASVGTTPGTAPTDVFGTGGAPGGNTTIATTGVGGIGSNVTVIAGAGGRATAAATSSTGGRGGTISLQPGNGGSASVAGTGTNTGGNGGRVSLISGSGGDATGNTTNTNTGGNGGALDITGGVGGSATTGSGGLVGGTGGAANLIGGVGGTGTTGGSGGDALVNGGTAGAGTDHNGGRVFLRAGIGTGAGTSSIIFQTATTLASGTTAQTNSTKATMLGSGNFGIGVTNPTAVLHLKAGTTTASTAPLKFNSGTLLGTAEAGAVEFLTDDWYATITTGAARKKFVLDDGTALTATRVPFATTNGRLTDDADMTFATDTLTVTKIVGSTSITDSGLTAGRVTFAGTAGILTDDADLTFATDTLTTTKLVITNKLTSYNGVTTAGWGAPAIQASARLTAQVAAVASVAAYTVGAADGSFLVSTNVNVTTATAHNFTVAVDYTDETNTARTLTLPVVQLAGTVITAITNLTGAGPYEGIATQIRCKASTAITVKTVGTFTTVTYNVEGLIQQVA